LLEPSRSVALFLVREHRGNPLAEIGGGVRAGIAAIRELTDIEDHAALFARGDAQRARPDVRPPDAAQVQYTSGTTGFPKGALLSHHGLINNAHFSLRRRHVRWASSGG
jgi:fatty-acyl-CoA synthase